MMLLKLLSETHARSCQAVVSMKDEGTIGPRIKKLGVPVYTLGLRPLLPSPLTALSLRSIVREFQPHVIQGWMYHGNVMASLASTLLNPHPPVIWDIQQSIRKVGDYGFLTGMVIRLGALLSRHPAKIIYVSHVGAKQHVALGYRPDKGIVIPNGIDCRMFYPDENARRQVRGELGIGPESVLIGLVARYHPMKDHLGFLAAAAEVVRNVPTARFLLIGKGVTNDQPVLHGAIKEHHLQHHAYLLGERQDTARLTAALDIACSASAWGEALSVAVGEAMACGVPCCVTDVGDSSFLVADTGLSVAPGNPGALASAIKKLIDAGSEYRRQLGMAARRRVESEFSLLTVARRYQELYEQLCVPGPAFSSNAQPIE